MGEGRLFSQAKYAGARRGERFICCWLVCLLVEASLVDSSSLLVCCWEKVKQRLKEKRPEGRVNKKVKKGVERREATLLVNIQSLQAAGGIGRPVW